METNMLEMNRRGFLKGLLLAGDRRCRASRR